MGLDVWFRQDVARILASTQETLAQAQGAVPPLDPERAGAYQQGFADALQSVALAFGLDDPGLVPAPRTFSGPPAVAMVEAPLQTSCVYTIVGNGQRSRLRPAQEDVP
jgi:hypothetical protein